MSRQEIEFALEHTEQYWLYYVADLSSDQPTTPIRLQNIGKLILERKLAFDLDSISLKLPAEVRKAMTT